MGQMRLGLKFEGSTGPPVSPAQFGEKPTPPRRSSGGFPKVGETYPMFLTADQVMRQTYPIDARQKSRVPWHEASHYRRIPKGSANWNQSARYVQHDAAMWRDKIDATENATYGDRAELMDTVLAGRPIEQPIYVGANPVTPDDIIYVPRRGQIPGTPWSRPALLGGHHRVAIMNEYHPNALIPVKYASSIREAQRSQGYT